MPDLKKIVWLASYPKSGNTWFRAFLTALLNPSGVALDINNMYDTTIASSRLLFDELAGVASADLTCDETDRLRPLVYRQNAQDAGELIYHKVHDAWQVLPGGSPLFPSDITKNVIYFIRDPRDVAVSFANHLHTGIDKTIEIMNNPEYAFCEKQNKLHNQLRQKLNTWSGHVKSWVDDSDLPVLAMRFEDMKSDPVKAFSKVVKFIGLTATGEEITAAVELSSFERLKQQEEDKGFSEKSAHAESFFRKGISGDWKNALNNTQVNRIIETHREMMVRFGYVD